MWIYPNYLKKNRYILETVTIAVEVVETWWLKVES